jgi:hypothetical protein
MYSKEYTSKTSLLSLLTCIITTCIVTMCQRYGVPTLHCLHKDDVFGRNIIDRKFLPKIHVYSLYMSLVLRNIQYQI